MRQFQYLACYCRVSVRVEPSLHTLLRGDAFPHPKSNYLNTVLYVFKVLITI